jgi:predicted CXXCH cytochrome family protein
MMESWNNAPPWCDSPINRTFKMSLSIQVLCPKNKKESLNSRLDIYTLQCVECHDKYLDRSFGSYAAGGPNRIFALSSHPVGVSLERIAAKKPRRFNFPHALPREIILFNGKIGCGTCHNAFSKEKSMLVMNNRRSRSCLKCHKK